MELAHSSSRGARIALYAPVSDELRALTVLQGRVTTAGLTDGDVAAATEADHMLEQTALGLLCARHTCLPPRLDLSLTCAQSCRGAGACAIPLLPKARTLVVPLC